MMVVMALVAVDISRISNSLGEKSGDGPDRRVASPPGTPLWTRTIKDRWEGAWHLPTPDAIDSLNNKLYCRGSKKVTTTAYSRRSRSVRRASWPSEERSRSAGRAFGRRRGTRGGRRRREGVLFRLFRFPLHCPSANERARARDWQLTLGETS